MVIGYDKTKRLQGIILDIFRSFKNICDEHGLKYYLIGGSCLGSVRHGGFIPWDDDIDVGMMRSDFEEFCRIAQPLLPPNLFLQTWRSDPPYYYAFAKIRNSATTYIETGLAKWDINHGVFMDVFPLDVLPCGIEKFQFRLKRALYDNYIAVHCAGANSSKSSWQQKIIRNVSNMIYKTPEQVLKKRDTLLIKTNGKNNGCQIANYYGAWSTKEIVPADWFGEGVIREFEGIRVRIPKEYHKYLTQLYGGYMQLPPSDKRVSHHYCSVIDLDLSYKVYTEGEKKMRRVITYGTFDLLHYGHINILRRARALGDYLIVALSTDEFNWNEKQKKCYFSYEQRKQLLEAIRYVDLVIPENCWEQKRTDVHEYHIDTFVMGNDWKGKFDFLQDEGVEVVYLPRTPEISTTQIKQDLNETASRSNAGGVIRLVNNAPELWNKRVAA